MKQPRKLFWTPVLICSFALCHVAFSSPVFVPSIYNGNGRNIRHLPCISRRTGETGVCMFAFTCAKANGTHLGTCIDRFYFGSCCKVDDELDTYAHDSIIDLENSLSQSKPFTTTIATTKATSVRTTESNDIPGNVDKFKPSDRPNSATIVKVTETTASSNAEKTHTKVEATTESIRLSTFQTVQNASDPRPTSSPYQRPTSVSRPKPTFTHSTSVGTSTFKSTTLPPSSASSYASVRPSLITYSSISTSKLPLSTLAVSKIPASAFESTTKSNLNKSSTINTATSHHASVATSFSPVTHKITVFGESTRPQDIITTIHKTPLVTRFPPRNVTLTTAIRPVETSTWKSTTPLNTYVKNSTDSQKQSTTRKPALSKKPTKITTKKPILSTTVKLSSITNANINISITTVKPLLSTSSVTNYSVSSVTKKSNATTATTVRSTSNNLTITTPKPFTTGSIFKHPSTTVKKPSTTVTKNPSLITTSQVITTIDKRPTSTVSKKNSTSPSRPTVTSTFKPASTTKKQTTTVAPTRHTTFSVKVTNTPTVNKATTPKVTSTHRPSTAFAGSTTTTTVAPSVLTTPSTTTHKVQTVPQTTIKPIQLTTTASPVVSTHHVNKVPATTQSTSTISNEIESGISNRTTVIPGIVTWSSFSDDIENATKATTSSSTAPDSVETNWITSPDGWIIVQSPTSTEKVETLSNSETLASVNISFTQAEKPTTEQATTHQSTSTASPVTLGTTQSTTVIDVLSTLATVTVSPEYTDTPTSFLNMSNFKDACGRRLFPESRIVGGDGSTFGKWPWQISLRQWRTSTYLHKCGAALLNENWAITAAHCVQNVLPSDLLLRIGEHDLGNEEEPYGFQERRVQIVASHPNFDPRTFEFDLALMRFYEPVLPFQPNVLPICIPDDEEDYVGQTAFVTGWGRLYEDGPLPSVLQEVAVPVINNSVCEGMYRNAGYIEHIPHIFICAGWRKGGFDSCEGDSGGPLVIQRKKDKRWVLAGVISWGIGCAEPNQPGVYTRISEFREWINQILMF